MHLGSYFTQPTLYFFGYRDGECMQSVRGCIWRILDSSLEHISKCVLVALKMNKVASELREREKLGW